MTPKGLRDAFALAAVDNYNEAFETLFVQRTFVKLLYSRLLHDIQFIASTQSSTTIVTR